MWQSRHAFAASSGIGTSASDYDLPVSTWHFAQSSMPAWPRDRWLNVVLAGPVAARRRCRADAGCAVRAPPSAAACGRLSLPRFVDVAPGGAVHRAGLRDGEWLLRVKTESAAAIEQGTLQKVFWLRDGRVLDLDVIAIDGRRRRVRVP